MAKSAQRNRRITKEQKERARTSRESTVPGFENLSKKDAEKKDHTEKQGKGHQDISRPGDSKNWEPVFVVVLVAVIGLIPAILGYSWSSHPTLSLWGTVVPLSLLILVTYYVLTRMVWRASHRRIKRVCLIAGAVIFLSGLGGQVWISTRPAPTLVETPLRGLLLPASDKTPTEWVPPNGVAIQAGGVQIISERPSAFIVRIAGEEMLSYEKTSDGMYLNAIVRNDSDEVVAQITKNVIRVKPASGYYAERPDEHTLVVIGPNDQKALYVRYSNPKAMKVLGVFKHRGRNPVFLEEGKDVPGLSFSGVAWNVGDAVGFIDIP